MRLTEYQETAMEFERMPEGLPSIAYCCIGLSGEAGEVANKVKKIFRDGTGGKAANAAIARELGDCLWYLSALARRMGYTLEDIAIMNLETLQGRKERGTLQGDGDSR